ncbi:MAG: hypothetical protein K2X91_07395, partial [Thermoleophilia bacterium]|nr:hypothetical protein [Thermoleophilia bacterium]
MNPLDRAERYLLIPPRYGAELGGLWWSSRRDAIERRDGTTLALADELLAVLDGALRPPACPPFAFVLNLLHLMKASGDGFDSLSQAYARTRGVPNRGRNVGRLIARLCDRLPRVPEPVTVEAVTLALGAVRRFGPHAGADAAEEPPLALAEFESFVADRLAGDDLATLVHWFTHGFAPGGGGEQLREQVETLPARIARLLAAARKRARLA